MSRIAVPHAITRTISAASLSVQPTSSRDRFERRPAKEDLTFGTTMSDHMLTIEWDQEWKDPKIIPFEDLKLNPAASALHYGMTLCQFRRNNDLFSSLLVELYRPFLF